MVYAGSNLTAHGVYSWTVRWWAVDGSGPSPYSIPAVFSVGPLVEADWAGAAWVGAEDQRQLRATFDLPKNKTVASALASVAAPGCHVLEANGVAAGDAHGMCPWLQYNKRILYQTRNLTTLLTPGTSNAIGVMLGRGFWSGTTSKFAPFPVARIVVRRKEK